MNIFTYFKKVILSSLEEKHLGILHDEDVKIEYPKNQDHGDISTNVAMVIARKIDVAPIEVAKELMVNIQNNEFVDKVLVAGTGFLNIYVNKSFWHSFLKDLVKLKSSYPELNIGQGEKVNVEFVSANPTGPLHIGHAKGAVFGDAISNLLLKCGYNVTKEFYINDAGNQITNLAKSLDIRYRQKLGEDVKLSDDCYPGEYLIDIAERLYAKFEGNLIRFEESEKEEILKNFAVEKILEIIKQDLQELGVYHDVFTSEKKLQKEGKIEEALDFLKSKNLLYEGILEKPKGEKVAEDWEPEKHLLFKSTLYGDDADRVVVKSDGSYTYFASDIAYHFDKINRGYNNMILLLGADHIGYKKRLTSMVAGLSDGNAKLDIKICQLVKLLKEGKQIKMSKRAGNFITLKEVLDEIGKDALRFAILSKSSDTLVNIDMEELKQQTKDNPLFYVQYASARANSIMRRAKEVGMDVDSIDIDEVDFSLLNTKHDISIIKALALFPKVLESCVNTMDLHKIPYYLYDLACIFHQTWSKGKKEEEIKFITNENLKLTKSRILLAQAVILVIREGLKILGIEAVESM